MRPLRRERIRNGSRSCANLQVRAHVYRVHTGGRIYTRQKKRKEVRVHPSAVCIHTGDNPLGFSASPDVLTPHVIFSACRPYERRESFQPLSSSVPLRGNRKRTALLRRHVRIVLNPQTLRYSATVLYNFNLKQTCKAEVKRDRVTN